MRLHVMALFVFFSAALLHSQEESPNPAEKLYSPQLTKDLITLRDAALSDDYAYRQVAHLTENIGPRPSGSLQAQAAVDYVAAELRKLDLEVRLEDLDRAEPVERDGLVIADHEAHGAARAGAGLRSPSKRLPSAARRR